MHLFILRFTANNILHTCSDFLHSCLSNKHDPVITNSGVAVLSIFLAAILMAGIGSILLNEYIAYIQR